RASTSMARRCCAPAASRTRKSPPWRARECSYRSVATKAARGRMEKLTGKTVLVTGSTDGVGRLVARRLGEAGAQVLVHGRDADRGAQIVADIERAGGPAPFLRGALASLADVRDLAAAVQRATNRLDILINNA